MAIPINRTFAFEVDEAQWADLMIRIYAPAQLRQGVLDDLSTRAAARLEELRVPYAIDSVDARYSVRSSHD